MKRIILIGSLLLPVALVAATTKTISTEALSVAPKQSSVQVSLVSNPTTGYRWFLKSYDHNLLKPSGHHYQRPDSTLMGVGGKEKFDFTVLGLMHQVPQETTLTFVYRRPWEKKSGLTKTVRVSSMKTIEMADVSSMPTVKGKPQQAIKQAKPVQTISKTPAQVSIAKANSPFIKKTVPGSENWVSLSHKDSAKS